MLILIMPAQMLQKLRLLIVVHQRCGRLFPKKLMEFVWSTQSARSNFVNSIFALYLHRSWAGGVAVHFLTISRAVCVNRHFLKRGASKLSKCKCLFFFKLSIHPLSIHCYSLPCADGGGRWRSLSQLSSGESWVATWTSCQFIAGPHRKTNSHSHQCRVLSSPHVRVFMTVGRTWRTHADAGRACKLRYVRPKGSESNPQPLCHAPPCRPQSNSRDVVVRNYS